MSPDSMETPLLRLVELARSASFEHIVGIVLVTVLIASVLQGDNKKNISNIPIHKASRLEPAIVLQSRFVTGARSIISSGYQKVFRSFQIPLFPHSRGMLRSTKVQRIAVHTASIRYRLQYFADQISRRDPPDIVNNPQWQNCYVPGK